MTPDQIRHVQTSFALVEPIAGEAATLFYANLFAADPALRPLFRGDMTAQGARLMQMIGGAVRLLERPSALMPVLRQLGANHAGYGVQAAHYATVGGALIQTLRQGLGEAFTPEVEAAWVALYGIVAETMQHGAAQLAAQPA